MNATIRRLPAAPPGGASRRRLPAAPPVEIHPIGANLDHIRSYYEALNSGDAELVASHFAEDATHYYTRLGPHHGREIADNAKWGVEQVDGQWWLEHGIESGDEAVIEWTMTWRDPKSGEKRLNRGTEWFRIDADGKIAEVRAYHHGDERNPQGDLLGFDHAGRGHTTLEGWTVPGERRA